MSSRRAQRTLVFGALICVVPCLSACDGDEDADIGEAQDPEKFARFFAADSYGVSACDSQDDRLREQREVRLYRNGKSDLVPYTRSLQRYYNRHRLSFFTRYEPASTDLKYALDTNLLSLQRAAQRALPGVDLSDENVPLTAEQEEKLTLAVTNQMLSPLISFANANGRIGENVTNIVLLPELVRPGGEDLIGGDGEIAGLAVSPALLREFARLDTEEGRIWNGVNLAANFTPMMFLHKGVLDRAAAVDPVARDLVVAHEFGHTGALVHTDEAHNLMLPGIAPGTYTCADGLNGQQIMTMQNALGINQGNTPQALSVDDSAGKTSTDVAARAERLRDVRRLLRGEPGPVPRFLRPLLHHHRL